MSDFDPKKGGAWLGAARHWIQWNAHNGSQVIWGSETELVPPVRVRQVEELAERVAESMHAEFALRLASLRAALEQEKAVSKRWREQEETTRAELEARLAAEKAAREKAEAEAETNEGNAQEWHAELLRVTAALQTAEARVRELEFNMKQQVGYRDSWERDFHEANARAQKWEKEAHEIRDALDKAIDHGNARAQRARAEALEEAREAAERAHVSFLNNRWPDLGDRPSSPPASIEPHWWAIDSAINDLKNQAPRALAIPPEGKGAPCEVCGTTDTTKHDGAMHGWGAPPSTVKGPTNSPTNSAPPEGKEE